MSPARLDGHFWSGATDGTRGPRLLCSMHAEFRVGRRCISCTAPTPFCQCRLAACFGGAHHEGLDRTYPPCMPMSTNREFGRGRARGVERQRCSTPGACHTWLVGGLLVFTLVHRSSRPEYRTLRRASATTESSVATGTHCATIHPKQAAASSSKQQQQLPPVLGKAEPLGQSSTPACKRAAETVFARTRELLLTPGSSCSYPSCWHRGCEQVGTNMEVGVWNSMGVWKPGAERRALSVPAHLQQIGADDLVKVGRAIPGCGK
jgi:hypothetical protein